MPTYATRHARVRAWQRYRAVATPEGWRQVWLDIVDTAAGERVAAALVGHSWDGKEVWRVELDGQMVDAVYDPDTATVVTVRARR